VRCTGTLPALPAASTRSPGTRTPAQVESCASGATSRKQKNVDQYLGSSWDVETDQNSGYFDLHQHV
jgi:hypothetical protein